MNLGEKIKQMQSYLDEEQIAKAIDLPVEVVKQYIEGDITDDVLEEYNIDNRPEVRIVEQKKFLRSKVTGVISTNNTDGSIVASLIAIGVSDRYKGDVALLDLGELPLQPAIMGMDDKETSLNLNFIMEEESIKRRGETHHIFKNLAVYTGAANSLQHSKLTSDRVLNIVNDISSVYGLVIVECTHGLVYWEKLVSQLDFIIIAVEQNYMGLSKYRYIYNMLKELNATDRALVILTKNGESGGLNVYESKRALKSLGNLEIIGGMEYDPSLYRRENVLKAGNKYEVINNAVNLIIPSVASDTKKGGIFKTLFGRSK